MRHRRLFTLRYCQDGGDRRDYAWDLAAGARLIANVRSHADRVLSSCAGRIKLGIDADTVTDFVDHPETTSRFQGLGRLSRWRLVFGSTFALLLAAMPRQTATRPALSAATRPALSAATCAKLRRLFAADTEAPNHNLFTGFPRSDAVQAAAGKTVAGTRFAAGLHRTVTGVPAGKGRAVRHSG